MNHFDTAFESVDIPPIILPPNTDDEPGVIWDFEDGVTFQPQLLKDAFKSIYDPEIPRSIYDIGLIYRVTAKKDQTIVVDFTLTTANCPEAELIPSQILNVICSVLSLEQEQVTLRLVWLPVWSIDRIPMAIQMDLGLL